jgi:hypothetical protein
LLLQADTFPKEYNYFKLGTEPDGFRGIKWGTEIKALQDMQYVGVDQDYPGNEVIIYHRKGDELQINGIPVSAIEYRFWRGLFFNVGILTRGHSNFMSLLRDTQKTYGKEHQSKKNIERYYWHGNRSSIVLEYHTKSQAGSMCIQSGDCTLINQQLKLFAE